MSFGAVDPDAIITAKLNRAYDLIEELQAMQAALRAGRADPEYQMRSNATDHSSRIVWIEWTLQSAPEPLPLSFSALLGDVLHNLRASLDYATWAAASEDARGSHPTQVSFPLCDKEAAFARWKKKSDGWFPEPTVEVIAWAQPYLAPPDQRHPLRILQQLSNVDKHRLLHTVEFGRAADPTVKISPPPPLLRVSTSTDPPKVGDTLLRVEFPRSPVSREIETRPNFYWYESVAYATPAGDVEWLRIDEMLNSISEFTIQTLDQMSGARGIVNQA